MTRTIYWCLFLCTGQLMVGCDAEPTGSTQPSPVASVAQPAAISPVSDVQAISFADKLTQAVNSDVTVDGIIDWTSVVDRSAQGLEMKPQSLASFRTGILKTMASGGFVKQIRDQILQGASYKRLRVHQSTEGTRVMMRLTLPGGGLNYHDYLLRDVNAQVVAVDVNLANVGEDMSQTIRRMLIPIAAKENRGLLERLSGQESLFLKHLDEIGKATKSMKAGQPDVALQTLSTLPLEVQNEKIILILQITAAQLSEDEDAQLQAIDRLRTNYPTDPATALHSIDYYIVKHEYQQAIGALQQLGKSVGGDAAVSAMIANILLESKDIPGAKAAVEQAFASEPDLDTAYWSRVTIALAEDDFATVLHTLRHIHDELEMPLTAESVRADPIYAKFIQSPEFQELIIFIEE